MIFNVQWIDVTESLARQVQPVIVTARAGELGSSELWCPQGNVLDGTAQFNVTRLGDAVRVPVWAYQTERVSLGDLFGLGLQIGLAAVTELRKVTQISPTHAYLYIGHECQDLRPSAECFRAFIGIALRTK